MPRSPSAPSGIAFSTRQLSDELRPALNSHQSHRSGPYRLLKSNILQVEAKRFTRSETTLQHQQYQRPIALAAQLLEQRLHLNFAKRPRHALDSFDRHAA